MSKKRKQPPRWDEIKDAARECGAGDWAIRKWLDRETIPPAWKLKIFEHTSGKISFDEMEIGAEAFQ
jgi:hypothetical protein